MAYPQIPAGYHGFTDLMGTLAIQRSGWSFDNNWLTHQMDACPIGHSSTRTSLETLQWWMTDAEPREAVRDRLGTMLASGTLRAAGLCVETGAMVWLPAACWRVDPGPEPGGPPRSMMDMACDRGRVRTSNLPTGRTYVPVIALRDLAEALGAKSLPPAPELEPDAPPPDEPAPASLDLPTPPKAFRWTACEAFTWVAFGEARHMTDDCDFPKAEWSRNWKQWPVGLLSNAFVEIGTGVPWLPDPYVWPPADWDGKVPLPLAPIWPPSRVANARQHARVMMAETGESARELNDALAADHEREGHYRKLLCKAMRDVLAAVRDGKLTVRARPTFSKGSTNISAVHKNLDSALFLGPRYINMLGNVAYDDATHGFGGLFEYKGPWFDDAHFDDVEVRALWPAKPTVPANASAWMVTAAEAYLAKWGQPGKASVLVQECRSATGCTARAAKAAQSELPPHLRLQKGRPRQ